MKNYFIAITLLFVTSSLFITSCKTPEPAKQKTLDKILASKTIVVGTTGEQFPFSFVDDDSNLKGLDISIANYLAKELEYGVWGAWLAMSADLHLRAVLVIWRYTQGKWKQIEV